MLQEIEYFTELLPQNHAACTVDIFLCSYVVFFIVIWLKYVNLGEPYILITSVMLMIYLW